MPATGDINTLVFRNAETLRSRSRDMVRRNPWASNALDAFVGNSHRDRHQAAAAPSGRSYQGANRDAVAALDRRGRCLGLDGPLRSAGTRLPGGDGGRGMHHPSAAAAAQRGAFGAAAIAVARGRASAARPEPAAAERRLHPCRDRVQRHRQADGVPPLPRASGRRAQPGGIDGTRARARDFGAAPVPAAASRPGARPALADAGADQAARARPVRRRRTGPEEDGGDVRRLRHEERARGPDPERRRRRRERQGAGGTRTGNASGPAARART